MNTIITRYCQFILFFSLLVFYVGCTEPIDIKLDASTRRLYVQGFITDDTAIQIVRLNFTSDYYSSQPSPNVTGAKVSISFNDDIVELQELTPGIYVTPFPFAGTPGTNYHLMIRNVDVDEDGVFEEYSAQSTLNAIKDIDSIALSKEDFFDAWVIKLYAKEPGETQDFYLFKAYKNSILLTDTLHEFSLSDDLLFNGNYIWGVPVYLLADDRPDEKPEPGDTITLEMYRINQSYYKFITEVQRSLFGSNPLFSGPPANPSSNISNEALGYFEALSKTKKQIVFKSDTN